MDPNLGFFQRLLLAFVAFFYVLANRGFAARVRDLRERERASLPPPPGAGAMETPAPEERVARPVPAARQEIPVPPRGAGPAIPATPAPGAPAPAARAAAPATRPPTAAAPVPTPAAPAPVPAPPAAPARPAGAEALHLLSLLQRDGRLVDFVAESLTGFSDSEIGAAARTVHEGCKKVIESYLTLEPVLPEPEGASVAVPAGFDPAAVRLTGNVVGAPPFRGTVRHHGWRAADVRIPPAPPGDARVVAPAEVEL